MNSIAIKKNVMRKYLLDEGNLIKKLNDTSEIIKKQKAA